MGGLDRDVERSSLEGSEGRIERFARFRKKRNAQVGAERNGQGRIIRAGIYRHVRGEIRVSSDAARARHVLKRGKEVALMGWDLNFVRRLRHDGLKLTCGSWFQLHQFELNLLPRGEVPLVLVLVGGLIDNKMRGIQRNGFIGRGSFFFAFYWKKFFFEGKLLDFENLEKLDQSLRFADVFTSTRIKSCKYLPNGKESKQRFSRANLK